MKRHELTAPIHEAFLRGETLSSTEIGELSDHVHPSNQVIDMMRREDNLPVHTNGYGSDGKIRYGYLPDDIVALKEDPEAVKERMRQVNKQKREERLLRGIERAAIEIGVEVAAEKAIYIAIDELGCDAVRELVFEMSTKLVFEPR